MGSIDYDAVAREYSRHRRVHPEVLRRLLLDGGIDGGSRVLEVGCGTGNYIAAIHRASGCECWGVDPSAAMLQEAAAQCPGVRLQTGRAEALGVPNGAFDLIFSVDVIHHVADRTAYFREAARALVPAERLCTVTDSEGIIRTRRPLTEYFPETVDTELRRYPRVDDLKALMADAGFDQILERTVEHPYFLTDLGPFREKAFSSLRLITPEAFQRGLARMAHDLQQGPLPCVSRCVMLWGRARPGNGREGDTARVEGPG
jgi:ubiquinone/menaquinone biosynthesis C-methylase UbiE